MADKQQPPQLPIQLPTEAHREGQLTFQAVSATAPSFHLANPGCGTWEENWQEKGLSVFPLLSVFQPFKQPAVDIFRREASVFHAVYI